ncbi:MAG: hypothetical protein KF746_17800 [Chitinophagaceae bacterium]|nr:hypothetical protein [Chitinophagaceae bacterium]
MKSIFYAVTGALVLLSISCKKVSELTKFDIKYNSETTIEAGIAAFIPFDINTPDIETQSEDQFKGHNTARDLVQSITLKELKISIISPEEQNFDFLKSIEIYISADEQEEVKIAWKNDMPDAGAKAIVLDRSNADLKPYLVSETYRLRLKTTTDKVLNKDVKIKIASIFRVDANILGL